MGSRDALVRHLLRLLPVLAAIVLSAVFATADAPSSLEGTWSGDWMIKGGVPDAVTVRLYVGDRGKLGGTFLSPARMECTTVSYVAKGRRLVLEAEDPKAGTVYRLVGRVSGTEILGTIESGSRTGTIRLIKWTYVPRPFGS